ncbi:MAG: hypothetical protein VB130_05785 [Clostridium sp.]|nr:hypothetical protein [Clostridium sp.]
MNWAVIIVRIICLSTGAYLIFRGLKLKEESLSDEKRNNIINIKRYILVNKIIDILKRIIVIVAIEIFDYSRTATICFSIL